MDICVVIPVYNEAKTIGAIVTSLHAQEFHVCVVDDGSCDGSGDIARTCGAYVLVNDQRRGKGYSLKRGFAYVCQQSYAGVMMMDGDGQHVVKDIKAFLECRGQVDACMVVGNRMSHAKGMPWVRYLTNWIMSSMISLVIWQRVPDTQCGFRYISCAVLKSVTLISNGYEIETELLMKVSKRGFPIFSVPIQTIYHDENSKINPVQDAMRFIVYFIKEIFSGRG